MDRTQADREEATDLLDWADAEAPALAFYYYRSLATLDDIRNAKQLASWQAAGSPGGPEEPF